jgi:hypothetical protein
MAHEQAAQRVEDAGFPKVANLLRADNARAAWAELRRFEPCSFGEGMAKARARKAMPEIEDEED